MKWNEFINNEKASLDTIDVKRIYIDMAGDLVSGVLLSQIVYWHLPSKSGEVRLTVEKDGKYWLAKKRDDWWDECRITPKQFDRSINVLEERQTVITQVFRYNGSPTKHIRINRDVFVAVYNAMLSDSVDFVKFQGGKWILTKGEDRTLPLVNIELPERGISETAHKPMPSLAPTLVEKGPEITTENTTENKDSGDFLGKNLTPGKDVNVSEIEKMTKQPNRVVGVGARKRLKGKNLQAFELVADNLRATEVTELERWCKNDSERVFAAYRETVKYKATHYKYFATVYDDILKKTTAQKTKGTIIDYDAVDTALYSNLEGDELDE